MVVRKIAAGALSLNVGEPLRCGARVDGSVHEALRDTLECLREGLAWINDAAGDLRSRFWNVVEVDWIEVWWQRFTKWRWRSWCTEDVTEHFGVVLRLFDSITGSWRVAV